MAAPGWLSLIGVGIAAPASFLSSSLFVLSQLCRLASHWNVLLYTPLMSVTNAISGIIIIGGMLQISGH